MSQLNAIYSALANQPRLLIEAELQPIQGNRFQPTGFPDLGAATYKRPDGTPMLLVESAQSMANRLEAICWDEAKDEIIAAVKGPVTRRGHDGKRKNSATIQEAHRLNSPYIVNDERLKKTITDEVGNKDTGPLDIRKLARAVFKHDAGAVLHGVFLEKVAGRLRLQRLLSSFIEAEGVETVTSGGVKLDRVDPTGDAAKGFGNVPFARTEFTAKRTVAYFNLDLATMRGYGLGEAAENLVFALALFKILRLLETGLRLRTACDFEVKSLRATRPSGIDLTQREALLTELSRAMRSLIAECGFGEQPLKLNSK